MRTLILAIALVAFGCGKKPTPDAKKPVPASTTPSDPQPHAGR